MPNNTSPSGKLVIRYILLAVLAVGLIAVVFDYSARGKAQAAFDQLQGRDTEKVGTTPDEVHKLIGRQPDKPANEVQGELQETFSWQGIRKYTVYVLYGRFMDADSKPAYTLDRVTLNQPQRQHRF